MRTAIQQKFIDELKVGYPQGREALVSGTTEKPEFCCLGVGAVKVCNAQIVQDLDADSLSVKFPIIQWVEDTILPNPIREQFGISDDLQNHLVIMNDGSTETYHKDRVRKRTAPPRDFNFIARYLEVVWPV